MESSEDSIESPKQNFTKWGLTGQESSGSSQNSFGLNSWKP